MKRIAYIKEVEKMTSLQIGESAIIEFDSEAKIVDITFTDKHSGIEETVQKYHFPITLHSHPKYPHLKEPIKLIWETIAKEPLQLNDSLAEMSAAGAAEAKHFSNGKWEIEILDNKKTKLWILK
jgi:hypothetical protein